MTLAAHAVGFDAFFVAAPALRPEGVAARGATLKANEALECATVRAEEPTTLAGAWNGKDCATSRAIAPGATPDTVPRTVACV